MYVPRTSQRREISSSDDVSLLLSIVTDVDGSLGAKFAA